VGIPTGYLLRGRTLNSMAGGRQWLIHLCAELRILHFYRIFDIRLIQVFGTAHEIQATN
jgi:hypothetical protein